MTSFGQIVPRTIVLILIILPFYYNQNFVLGMAIFFGFIMDAYYLGFIGVYMAAFVLIVYIFSNLKNIYEPNILSYTLFSVLGLTAFEIFVYGIMRILGITTLSFQMFLATRLGATLLFNAVVMLLISFFVDLWIQSVMDEG
jgi:rod shape-determining protein MreD